VELRDVPDLLAGEHAAELVDVVVRLPDEGMSVRVCDTPVRCAVDLHPQEAVDEHAVDEEVVEALQAGAADRLSDVGGAKLVPAVALLGGGRAARNIPLALPAPRAREVPEEPQPRRCDDRGRDQGETQVGTRRLSKDAREFRPTQDTALRSPTSTP